ncbi:BrxA family protein [Desulfobulbus alkaliphilus]|uniref:BrxA family protein n=1 Tax=Desulfobulbus alkaliphilus TaxID=869814 RepID=UPI001966CE10|nr:BrxA family protein [Desulfobulbus alkaliphilus]MBM9538587.1 DUF1819 family protein [Desulfobulbus alkaliphilus]
MQKQQRYTTQLQAGLGMIPETLDLLRLWEPGMLPSQLADRVIEEGLFSRATARRARNIVIEMFAPRLLADGGEAASRLKVLLDHRVSQDALVQLFFLQTARAQRIFKDFVIECYWPRYSAGASSLSTEDASKFIYRALDNGKMLRRWSDTTVKRLTAYLMGCCHDFGLLASNRGKNRPIQRFTIRPDVALYLVYDLHCGGLSDMGTILHEDWKLFGLESQDVIRLLKKLGHDRHLFIQASADLVQISWKYRTMGECLHAITQR